MRVPPIKCQGIKTRLVPFLFQQIAWNPGRHGRWVEPFLGSGVVAFNLAPERALLADINPHLIGFYQAVQQGVVTPERVRAYLLTAGEQLARHGAAYYYEVRDRFNRTGSPYDFLFLNRACFNGLMRFNARGEFNVPFCRKVDRFTPAYVSKVVNQVTWVSQLLQQRHWELRVASWEETLGEVLSRVGFFLC